MLSTCNIWPAHNAVHHAPVRSLICAHPYICTIPRLGTNARGGINRRSVCPMLWMDRQQPSYMASLCRLFLYLSLRPPPFDSALPLPSSYPNTPLGKACPCDQAVPTSVGSFQRPLCGSLEGSRELHLAQVVLPLFGYSRHLAVHQHLPVVHHGPPVASPDTERTLRLPHPLIRVIRISGDPRCALRPTAAAQTNPCGGSPGSAASIGPADLCQWVWR